MVALHPTTTADVDTRKHMDLHLCDSSHGSWMHIPFCRLAHAHAAPPAGTWIRRESYRGSGQDDCFSSPTPTPTLITVVAM